MKPSVRYRTEAQNLKPSVALQPAGIHVLDSCALTDGLYGLNRMFSTQPGAE